MVFSFSLFFFVFLLCVRLSWPSRQLLSARKYKSFCTVSYVVYGAFVFVAGKVRDNTVRRVATVVGVGLAGFVVISTVIAAIIYCCALKDNRYRVGQKFNPICFTRIVVIKPNMQEKQCF